MSEVRDVTDHRNETEESTMGTAPSTLYRSKPSEVEAVQWTGDNFREVAEFGAGAYQNGEDEPLMLRAGKDGAQDYVPVPVGHWIVRSKGDTSDHWPVDPDYFAAKYEPVEASDG